VETKTRQAKSKQAKTEQAMPGSHQRRETHDLIGSDKVEGTNVYRSNGEKIGQIERVMLEKTSGKVAFAVMSFGGFLGLGHDHYPVPWQRLTYNERLGGYEVDISDEELKSEIRPGQRIRLERSGSGPQDLSLLSDHSILVMSRR
jgi:hypothetical protein